MSAPTVSRRSPTPPSTPPVGALDSGRSSATPETTRRRPWLTILVAIAVLAAVLASVARGVYRDGPLEPDAPTEQGSKATVQVLTDLGVDVQTDRHTDDAVEALDAGRTVLVTAPSDLSGQQLTALAEAQEDDGGQLVQPDFVTLSYFTSAISPTGSLRTEADLTAGPGCGDLAHGARQVHVPGAEGLRGSSSVYRTADGAEGCFDSGDGSLVAAEDGIIVLGSADLLTNAGISEAENSALVLNVLGESGELTWYVPSAGDPMGSSGQSLVGYLPDWAGPVALWILAVGVIAMVALGRRFGPVVVEPLPVTVRPQELVLGRARLLQRSDARDAAATSLRSATSTRLADRLGLRHESALDGLLAALAPHTDRSPEQLRTLLGPTPVTTDEDLVRLAQDLDRLEKEIDR
ncbi:MAG: DUF4350 domain-containing protein [Brachybacterium tyrofermentans]